MGSRPFQTQMVDERVMPKRPVDGYRSCIDTKTFKITTTVREEGAQTAREQLQAIADDLKERVPEVTVSEITTEPATDERLRPLRFSEVYVN